VEVLSRVLVRRRVTAHDVPAPHGDSHGACAPKPISVPAFRNGLRRDRMTRPRPATEIPDSGVPAQDARQPRRRRGRPLRVDEAEHRRGPSRVSGEVPRGFLQPRRLGGRACQRAGRAARLAPRRGRVTRARSTASRHGRRTSATTSGGWTCPRSSFTGTPTGSCPSPRPASRFTSAFEAVGSSWSRADRTASSGPMPSR
jgi:hypothetical protein